MKRILLLICAVFTLSMGASAQILQPVKWNIQTQKISSDVYDIICKATINKDWHLYDTEIPENGPVPTTFNTDDDETTGVEPVGKLKATTKPLSEYSKGFEMELRYFKTTVTFVQRIKIVNPKARLTGYIEFMACRNGQCIPPDEAGFDFRFTK